MPYCPSCGKEYAQVGVTFCPNCGKPVQAATPIPAQGVKYCQKCGAPNDAGVGYCQKCGEMRFGPTPPARLERPLGVTILSVIQIVGSLFVLGMGFFVASVLGALGTLILPLAVLPLLFAIALFSGRNWARILMMIGAVFDIISIVGIIWGAVLLWYLTRPRVVAYFKQPK